MNVSSKEIQEQLEESFKLLEQLAKNFQDISTNTRFAAEDWEEHRLAGDTFFSLWAFKQRVAEIYAAYEEAVWPYFSEPFTLANGATLESKEGTPRVGWKHKEIANAVVERIVDESFDFETGEQLRSMPEMVKELLQYAGVGYWKVKKLREKGIDPDHYSVPKDPTKSIKVSTVKDRGEDNDE